MHEELELKLAVTLDQLKRLRRDPLIRSLVQGRASTRHLHNAYFDTPARDLSRRGMALRVRRIGKRRVQTLKVPGNGTTGLQHHQEYESELESDTPDIARIEDEALRRMFDSEGLTCQLAPVFTTDFRRSSIPLKLEESEVELALDSGEISVSGQCLPICEAELELVSGSSERIYELALALHGRIQFRLESRTKAERGYQLSAKRGPRPQKAKILTLTRAMTVSEAFVVAARSCLEQIKANEPVVLLDREAARDPEDIHQLRVGVRRLRALISVFKTVLSEEARAFLRTELAWLHAALGPAREWDVFILQTLMPLCRRLPDDPDLAALRDAATGREAQANQSARAALLAPRYTELLLRLELWLENGGWSCRGDGSRLATQRVGRFAADALNQRANKLHGLTRKWKTLPEAELHNVRILAKKLRYAVNFFQTLYPKSMVQSQLAAITQIQDTLGSLNDAVVIDAQLADLDGKVTERALAIVGGWQTACIERDLVQFREQLKAYEKCRKRWR